MVNEILSQSLVESVDAGGVVWKMPSPCYFKLFAWNAPRHMNPYEVGIFRIVCTKGSQKKKVHHFHTLPGKKTYPTNGRKLSSGRVNPQFPTFFVDLYFGSWGLLGPSLLFFWFGDLLFVFSSNDMRASFWRMAPRQASTVTNSWPKLGLQFVTGMTLLGNYYIVMFINQLRSGLIIPNSLVSCVMWMELVQELGVFKVSARFW